MCVCVPQCEQEGKLWAEECLDFASSLPDITGLDDVLPQKVIKNEKRNNFVKVCHSNDRTPKRLHFCTHNNKR